MRKFPITGLAGSPVSLWKGTRGYLVGTATRLHCGSSQPEEDEVLRRASAAAVADRTQETVTHSGPMSSLAWQAQPADAVVRTLATTRSGLSRDEPARRLDSYGPNALPERKPPFLLTLFLGQFRSPLIFKNTTPIPWTEAILIGAAASVVLWVEEIRKWLARRLTAHPEGLVGRRHLETVRAATKRELDLIAADRMLVGGRMERLEARFLRQLVADTARQAGHRAPGA